MSIDCSRKNIYCTILIRITNCIIRNIIQHLIDHMPYSLYRYRISLKWYIYIFFRSRTVQMQNNVLCQFIQIYRFKRKVTVFFIQSGKLNDICDQRTQTTCFMINPARKFRHLFIRNHPIHHKFCISGDWHKWCLELMRNICRKFSAHCFCLFQFFHLFGDLFILLIHPSKKRT